MPDNGDSARTVGPDGPARVVRVGLTGGIGSGKTEVARRLAGHGAVVIDADLAAREVTAPGTDGLAEITAEFGQDMVCLDGSLDRERLAEIVFGFPPARERLNAIVHPRVGDRMAEMEAEAPDGTVVVHDIPLLAENGLAAGFGHVIVVDVPLELQTERLVKRGMTLEQADARISAQASREDRLAVATVVIDNSGTLADLDDLVKAVWLDLQPHS
jgi:dephospho-CoA kinase